MKKIIAISLLTLVSCKKDNQQPTPTPTGPCYCGEITQKTMGTSFFFTVKNNCTGNYGTFAVSENQFSSLGTGSQWCQAVEW